MAGLFWLKEGTNTTGAGERFDVRLTDNFKKGKFGEIEFKDARSDFGEQMLFLRDPDGLQLELVSTSNANPDRVWEQGPVPTEHAIRGFHRVTLSENGYERTASLLTDTLGFKQIAKEGNRFRELLPLERRLRLLR